MTRHRPALSRLLAVALLAAAFGLPNGCPAARAKQVLVFSLTRGFRHRNAIAKGDPILKNIAENLGYQCTISEDPAVFDPDAVKKWDVIIFNNCTGRMLLTRPERRKAFMDHIRIDGAGFMGFHAATDCFYDWPEYGKMMDGYFDGHPWNQVCASLLEEPDHPLLAPFHGKPFVIRDEIYQYRNYDRRNVRVLMSLDPTSVDVSRGKRRDRDNPLCWIRRWGKGRIYYSEHGHYAHIFQNKTFQQHIRLAMQWAMGDLQVPDTPRGGAEDLHRMGLRFLDQLRAAKTPEQQAQALHYLAWRPVPEALDTVRSLFETPGSPAVAASAAAALEAVAAMAPTLPREQKITLLKKILAKAADPRLRNTVVADLRAMGVADIPLACPPGFVGRWLAAGPIPDPDGAFFDTPGPPESRPAAPPAPFLWKGKRYAWRPATAAASGVVDLSRLFHHRTRAAAYLYARVELPKDTPAELRLGSDDGFVLWLNGKRLGGKNVHRGLTIGSDRFRVTLKRGPNVLLLKVLQAMGSWAACVQLLAPDGAPLQFHQPKPKPRRRPTR